MKLTSTLVIAGIGLLALDGQASAHAHLKSSTPAMGGTVATAPSELDLDFTEGLNLRFTGIKVLGPDKKAIPMGDAALGASGDTTLVVPVPIPLAAGTYTVSWHALSTDGHKTTGTYKFTVKP